MSEVVETQKLSDMQHFSIHTAYYKDAPLRQRDVIGRHGDDLVTS